MTTDLLLALAIGIAAPLLVFALRRRAPVDLDLGSVLEAARDALRPAARPAGDGDRPSTAAGAPAGGTQRVLKRLSVDRPLIHQTASATSADGLPGADSAKPRAQQRVLQRLRLAVVGIRQQRATGSAAPDAEQPALPRRVAVMAPDPGVPHAARRRQSNALRLDDRARARVRGWLGRDPNAFEHVLFRALFAIAGRGHGASRDDWPVPEWSTEDLAVRIGYIRVDRDGACPQCALSAARSAHFCQGCGRDLSQRAVASPAESVPGASPARSDGRAALSERLRAQPTRSVPRTR